MAYKNKITPNNIFCATEFSSGALENSQRQKESHALAASSCPWTLEGTACEQGLAQWAWP